MFDREDELLGCDDRLAIALRLAASGSTPTFPIVTTDVQNDGSEEFTSCDALDISPEAFTLPPNVDIRFRHLISAYRLVVDDPSSSNAILPIKTETDDANADSGGDSGQKDWDRAQFAVGKPRWMLWTYAEEP